MTWTRLSDDYADDAQLNSVSRSARHLNTEALCWCNKHLTDGALPAHMLRRITDADDPQAEAGELVTAGLWTEAGDGWQVDWTAQLPAEKINSERERKAKNKADYDERGELHNQGDHSKCTKNCPHVTGSRTGYEPKQNRTRTVSRPVPTPRERTRDKAGKPASTKSADALFSTRPPREAADTYEIEIEIENEDGTWENVSHKN